MRGEEGDRVAGGGGRRGPREGAAHGDARREADGADEAGGRLEELRGPARRRRVADLPTRQQIGEEEHAAARDREHGVARREQPHAEHVRERVDPLELVEAGGHRVARALPRRRRRARRLPALRRHKVVLRDDLDERAAAGGAVGEGAVQPPEVALVDGRRLVQRRRLRLAPRGRLRRRDRRPKSLARRIGRAGVRMPRGESQLDEAAAQAGLVELGAGRCEEGVHAVDDAEPVVRVRVAVVVVGAPDQLVGDGALRFRPLLGFSAGRTAW